MDISFCIMRNELNTHTNYALKLPASKTAISTVMNEIVHEKKLIF